MILGVYARESSQQDTDGVVKIVGSSLGDRLRDNEVIYGCRKSDFMGDYQKKIAVLFRGACSFETKIHNALRMPTCHRIIR